MIEIALLLVGSMVLNALSQSARTTRQAWRQAASTLGLDGPGEGIGASLVIAGTVDGRTVHVGSVARAGSGDRRATRFRVGFREPLPLDVRLGRESGLTGLGRLVGIEDVAVGDAAFDRAVLVTGRASPGEVRRWLTAGRRLRAQRFIQGRNEATVDRTGLTWTAPGTLTDAGRIVAQIRHGLEVAEALEGAGDAPLDVAAERLAGGDAGGAVAALRDGEERAAFDALLLEGQVLHAAGRHEEAAAALRRAERAARGLGKAERTEARDWLKAVEAARHGTIGTAGAPVRAPAPTGASPAPADDGPDLAATCRDLFDGPAGHAPDVGERFEVLYRDRRVRWAGTLLGVEEAALDFVFGDQPLVRAVFHVHGADGAGLGLDAVRAVVRLPAGSAKALEGRVGSRVAFTGRLAAVDTFARNLYVDEGAIAGA